MAWWQGGGGAEIFDGVTTPILRSSLQPLLRKRPDVFQGCAGDASVVGEDDSGRVVEGGRSAYSYKRLSVRTNRLPLRTIAPLVQLV